MVCSLYPPAEPTAAWGQLHPDRLAEHFVGRHLQRQPAFADPILPGAGPDQLSQLLTVYSRAAAHPALTTLAGALTELCVRNSALLAGATVAVAPQVEAPQPLLAALQQIVDDPAMTPRDLDELAGRLPDSSHVLTDLSAHIAQRLVDHHRTHAEPNDEATLPDLAMGLNNLSVRLGDVGRREEGLAAITEAVDIHRKLAEVRPAVHQQDLERSLEVLTRLQGEATAD